MAHFYLLQIIQLYLEFIVIQMLKTLAEGVGCVIGPPICAKLHKR